MEPYKTTRRCHHCDRQSWLAAEGKPCPWCGRRTGKYDNIVKHVVLAFSILSLCSAAYVLSQL